MSHDPRIIPRSEWGARRPRAVIRLQKKRGLLVGHHTASSMPKDYHEDRPHKLATVRAERKAMRDVQAFHQDGRGWWDIAYNFVIFGSGNIYRARGHNVGAHADGHNSASYGVCFYGNFATVDRPDQDAIDAWIWLTNHLQKGGFLIESEDLRIVGHGQLPDQGTACPGRLVKFLDEVRRRT